MTSPTDGPGTPSEAVDQTKLWVCALRCPGLPIARDRHAGGMDLGASPQRPELPLDRGVAGRYSRVVAAHDRPDRRRLQLAASALPATRSSRGDYLRIVLPQGFRRVVLRLGVKRAVDFLALDQRGVVQDVGASTPAEPALQGIIATHVVAADIDPLGEPADAESRAHAEFVSAVLGLAAHQAPERMESTRLHASIGELSGLLLRSPEPIDWKRTGEAAWVSNAPAPVAVRPGSVKIAELAWGADGADDIVVLLPREDASLAGYRIEFRPADDAEAPWVAFGDVATTNGREGAPVIVAQVPGALPSAPVEFRLFGPDGVVSHQRVFLPLEAYVPLHARVARRADGSSACLLFDAPLGVEPLRLDIVFWRDRGGPVLRQAGESGPERATLHVPG